MKQKTIKSTAPGSVLLQAKTFMAMGLIVLAACKPGNGPAVAQGNTDSLAIRKAYASSPVLSPEESLKKMRIEPGFAIKLVAAEPLVNSPVAMSFDDKGRMWVLEMENYMPDTVGTGEDKPAGKIVILTDTNRDGVADTRKVFMDSLVLPRAICLIENGILIAEPPRLWYVKIENDRPGKKVLVDSLYTQGGNVEHQPNSLYRAMDNWIYNSEAVKRYRKKGNRWIIDKIRSRGQWGMSQDDYGRLYYNNNSQNLMGDYFAPGIGPINSNQRRVSGYNENVVPDNRVYPARPTPGVNRGYMKGTLDDSLRLVNFTAASGPVVYRGNLFGKDYYLNAFVGEPSANLIKRDILEEKGYVVRGREAYKGKEFLSSTDERFRPVTLYNGPDGALYVVDMYRGIIQHKTYLTEYLKSEIKSRHLSKPLSCGRIYKIIPQNSKPEFVSMPSDPEQLVKLLEHPNGWVRDKAQQMLVDGKFVQVAPSLRKLMHQSANPVSASHALWTLEGLGVLQPGEVLPLLNESVWPIRMQALSVLPSIMNRTNWRTFMPALNGIVQQKDTLAAPYVAFLVQTIWQFDSVAARRLLLTVIKQYPSNVYVSDAAITNLQGREAAFQKEVLALYPDTTLTINKRLARVLVDIRNSRNNKSPKVLEKEYPKGMALFRSTCQTCHGADGNGIRALAPPLNHSDWVLGDKDKLIPIVLFGLTGPVKVSGTLYQAPEINGDMPAIGFNADLTDEDIAQVVSLVRNSWSNNADKVSTADVTRLRQKYKGRQKAFTMDELKK